MDYDKIKEYHERRPFKPFDIRTADGRVYSVDHPEFLMQSRNRRTVVYTTEDDREVALDARQITALEVANTHAA
jgi:hypothetical protein